MTGNDDLAPFLSVVIPARRCRVDLQECLNGLKMSRCQDFEVIVVDDASPDDTSSWIDSSMAQVLVLPRQSGPGAARNRGAQAARGKYLLFLDADVCVHPETIGNLIAALKANPTVTAIFGSYDVQPPAQNVLSQYRNLMHHFVHQQARAEATTFWSGCGAIRRDVFLQFGGFHPDYRRPCIEDIELGVRLCKAGHRILLDKQVQVAHRKCWTLWGMLKTDIRDRAWPWSRLIVQEGKLPNDLNLGFAHRISALLACGLVLTLLAAAWYLPVVLALPVAIVIGIGCIDKWSQTKRVPTSWRLFAVVAGVAIVALLTIYFKTLMLLPLALLAGIVLLNWRFYTFLAKSRHPLFAALALPLQIMHYCYSLAAFALASGLHLLRIGARKRTPAPVLHSSYPANVERQHAACPAPVDEPLEVAHASAIDA